jgi:hypothetical protein
MIRRIPAVVLLATLAVTACGDDSDATDTTSTESSSPGSTPPSSADGPVLIYEATGGCQMMGPNCPRYEVFADGRVEIYRGGENEPAEVTGTVDAETVAAFLATADREASDFDAFVERLGEGTCLACLDGVDILLDVKINGKSQSLNSTVVSFDSSEPFFEALDTLIAEVSAVGELPIEQR